MQNSYDLRALAPTVCKILGVRPPRTAHVEPLLEVFETMGVQDRLAVVVIDAFGASTWAQVRIETPTFNAFANRHLLHLSAVMPTVTPVNFATMLTGAAPDVHLIRSREDELTLETIFDVLRTRGKSSATAARALSTLGILLSPFADHSGIAESNGDHEVSSIAVEAMKGRPDLLWVQLLDVDDAGHKHGPVSSQGIEAAKRADLHLREMAVEAFWQGYAIMVLADHGQHTVNGFDGSVTGTHGTIVDEDVYVPLVWCRPEELGEALGLA
ncbi:MAG: alkaline phosphatase family protein [Candidatus Bathyarchaeota archaeon]|nr:MAG: alkaline phosphatase family protein [Candidatus Bathyarchaeota archaeon]